MSAPTFSPGFARGVTAFADGRVPVPALDPSVVASLAGVTIGDGVEYLRGWVAGWHSSNLLAPLPDDACGAELDSFDEEPANA